MAGACPAPSPASAPVRFARKAGTAAAAQGGGDGRKVPVGCGTLMVQLCLDDTQSPNAISPPLCTVGNVVCPLWRSVLASALTGPAEMDWDYSTPVAHGFCGGNGQDERI
ncbi:hypothetical protein WISP_18439 [Willisornis vidua]|uniref:Uncharacterized protein n=1 Tax=Willisornis vidua TaxID=1566151 RepID=A0ABQ9DUV0_9PASS|nr:hypothetical protein WISP_18439 [Willisornis vidua]